MGCIQSSRKNERRFTPGEAVYNKNTHVSRGFFTGFQVEKSLETQLGIRGGFRANYSLKKKENYERVDTIPSVLSIVQRDENEVNSIEPEKSQTNNSLENNIENIEEKIDDSEEKTESKVDKNMENSK